MTWFISLAIAVISLFLAAKLSEYVIDSAVKISNLLHIRTLIFGILFVSVVTTLPELSVVVFSGLKGENSLSFGNLLGSVVVNIGLVLALISWKGVKLSKISIEEISKTGMLIILSVILVLFMKELTYVFSLFLLIFFVLYLNSMKKMYFIPRKRTGLFTAELVKSVFLFLLCTLGVVIFAKIGVDSIIDFIREMGISGIFIGSTLVALETSLPELFIAIGSIRKSKYEIGIGDIMGSNVVNVTFLLSLVAFIGIPIGFVEKIIVLFVIISVSSAVLLSSKEALSKIDSLIFFSIFLAFLLFLFYFQIFDFI